MSSIPWLAGATFLQHFVDRFRYSKWGCSLEAAMEIPGESRVEDESAQEDLKASIGASKED
jgi:hypothetical protein